MDIVQRQECALAARVGKVKAARNVLPRKAAGELVTNDHNLMGLVHNNDYRHGTCSGPGDCLCKPGWKGALCDQVDMFC